MKTRRYAVTTSPLIGPLQEELRKREEAIVAASRKR